MRILHVATLFTPDADYGGPTRVALNQAEALAARGHDVTVTGAFRGFDGAPPAADGVTLWQHPAATLIPRIGFAGLRAKGLPRHTWRTVRGFDVVHVHVSREFVTLPAARIAGLRGVPYVVQPHGMVDATEKLLARPVDALLTGPVLAGAARVLCLTETERRRIVEFAGAGLPLVSLPNGVPIAAGADGVRTAPDAPGGVPEVLFLARLHERKRPEMFARAAAILLGRGVRARFTVAGPDGGCAAAVDRIIAATPGGGLRREGPVPPAEVPARLGRAAVYVLPSVHEPFGMSVLEAMGAGRPVIVTRSNGLAKAVARHDCGIVVDESESALVEAMADLLADPARAAAAGERARAAAHGEFGMGPVVDRLESIYAEVAGATRGVRA